mgnify:CR=1 FL=1
MCVFQTDCFIVYSYHTFDLYIYICMYLRPTLRMQLSEIGESLHVKKHFSRDAVQLVNAPPPR